MLLDPQLFAMDQDEMITDPSDDGDHQQISNQTEQEALDPQMGENDETYEENGNADRSLDQSGAQMPTDTQIEEFPPLPSKPRQTDLASNLARTSRVRLVFGRGQNKEVETPKRPQPPSPVKDRSPKRHASLANPQLGTQEQPGSNLGSPATPSQSAREDSVCIISGTRNNTPQFAFRDGFVSTPPPRVSGPTSTHEQRIDRTQMEVDDLYLDQSATAIADSEWDQILRNSPTPHSAGPKAREANLAPHKTIHTTPEVRASQPFCASSQAQRSTIHPDIKVENHIVTNATGLQRTATPNGGWPKIHLISSPLDNVVPSQVEAWNKVITGKLWARIFRGKYEQNSLATVDKTRALIKSLVRIDSEVSLGVSFPLQEQAREMERFPTPYHMLVSGLTPAQVDHLTNLETVSTKDITVIFKSFNDQRPTFVLTIFGLTFGNSEEERAAVTDLVKNCVKNSEAIMKHITDCAPKLSDRVAHDIFNNISVKFLEVKRNNANGGDFRGWNVFLHHSYLLNDDHVKLIHLMRMCTFPSATSGFGLPLRGKDTLLCVNCKSIDYDMLNCPFPDIPGWLGYKPAPTQQTQGNMAAYGDDNVPYAKEHSYYRGRGRGRGGRWGRPYYRRGFRGQWS